LPPRCALLSAPRVLARAADDIIKSARHAREKAAYYEAPCAIFAAAQRAARKSESARAAMSRYRSSPVAVDNHMDNDP